jgi:hypothetical protein
MSQTWAIAQPFVLLFLDENKNSTYLRLIRRIRYDIAYKALDQ